MHRPNETCQLLLYRILTVKILLLPAYWLPSQLVYTGCQWKATINHCRTSNLFPLLYSYCFNSQCHTAASWCQEFLKNLYAQCIGESLLWTVLHYISTRQSGKKKRTRSKLFSLKTLCFGDSGPSVEGLILTSYFIDLRSQLLKTKLCRQEEPSSARWKTESNKP